MHRVASPRPETTFQVRPATLGHPDTAGLVVSVTLRRGLEAGSILVESDDDRWEFVDVEDGLAAPIGGEPEWMDAGLQLAGVELAR